MNRLFRRRGGLPRTARLQRTSHDQQSRHNAFGRPRFGPQDTKLRWQKWLWRTAMATLVAGMFWFVWQSWIGLRVFDN